MAQELQGVPKLLLQIVFGKALGRRIWDQTRATSAQPPSPANQVTDTEISSAMLDYVSRRAADMLREHSRQARAIQLKVTYAHGETRVARTLLARPTSEGTAIAEAATKLLSRLPASGVQSVNLALRTAGRGTDQEQVPTPVPLMASPSATVESPAIVDV